MDFRGDVDVYCCWNRFVYLVCFCCCCSKEAAFTLPYLLTQTNLNRFALGRVFCAIDISDRCARVKLNTHFMLMSLICCHAKRGACCLFSFLSNSMCDHSDDNVFSFILMDAYSFMSLYN